MAQKQTIDAMWDDSPIDVMKIRLGFGVTGNQGIN